MGRLRGPDQALDLVGIADVESHDTTSGIAVAVGEQCLTLRPPCGQRFDQMTPDEARGAGDHSRAGANDAIIVNRAAAESGEDRLPAVSWIICSSVMVGSQPSLMRARPSMTLRVMNSMPSTGLVIEHNLVAGVQASRGISPSCPGRTPWRPHSANADRTAWPGSAPAPGSDLTSRTRPDRTAPTARRGAPPPAR